jgi:hypothetical protein
MDNSSRMLTFEEALVLFVSPAASDFAHGLRGGLAFGVSFLVAELVVAAQFEGLVARVFMI